MIGIAIVWLAGAWASMFFLFDGNEDMSAFWLAVGAAASWPISLPALAVFAWKRSRP